MGPPPGHRFLEGRAWIPEKTGIGRAVYDGDIARCSLGGENDYYNEDLLYSMLGVNAELLIDHAWGWEPVTIDLIKAYRPETNSISSGQVLQCPYDVKKGNWLYAK